MNEYNNALVALNENIIYKELSNHGVRYPAVRGFRDNGNGYSVGLG
jgi:hypothetical protein